MKKYLVAVLAFVLIVVGALLPLLLPGRSPVTRAKFDRVKEGMSRSEVEAMLGPPGDYRTRPIDSPLTRIEIESEYGRDRTWHGDEGSAWLLFDDNDAVCQKLFFEPNGPPPGAIESMRWRWDRWLESFCRWRGRRP